MAARGRRERRDYPSPDPSFQRHRYRFRAWPVRFDFFSNLARRRTPRPPIEHDADQGYQRA
eukprot:scaffold6586_cov115-Pinguiococcus_pyrenoidosus.AAC.1